MKTTLDLPDPLMRRVKIRAASESRKLKDVIAELLEKGMDSFPAERMTEGEAGYVIDPGTGMAMARTLNIPGIKPPTLEEAKAMIEQINEEEDLHRAGLLG